MKKRGKNKIIILTFDYELFLKKSGTPDECLFAPTSKILTILKNNNIKATFFIDILYYIRLKEDLEYHAKTIEKYENQIKNLLNNDHRVELHIHPHWLDAKFEGGQWFFDNVSQYSFANFNQDETTTLFNRCYRTLSDLCRKYQPDYQIQAYRAGGLCILPFHNLFSLFKSFNIKIDSSVAPCIKAEDKYQGFDYSNIKNINYYKFNNDPTLPETNGQFLELPISTYTRNLFDKFSEKIFTLKYKQQEFKVSGNGIGLNNCSNSKIFFFTKLKTYNMPFTLDGSMPETILRKIKHSNNTIITFISHPKLFSPISEKTLNLLIKKKYEFITVTHILETTRDE